VEWKAEKEEKKKKKKGLPSLLFSSLLFSSQFSILTRNGQIVCRWFALIAQPERLFIGAFSFTDATGNCSLSIHFFFKFYLLLFYNDLFCRPEGSNEIKYQWLYRFYLLSLLDWLIYFSFWRQFWTRKHYLSNVFLKNIQLIYTQIQSLHHFFFNFI